MAREKQHACAAPDFCSAREFLRESGRFLSISGRRPIIDGEIMRAVNKRFDRPGHIQLPVCVGELATFGLCGVGVSRPYVRQPRKAIMLGTRHFLLQSAALFRGDFDGARKPASEGAIEKRVADEKHEEDWEQRDGDSANDHFGFKAGAKLLAASFSPETENCTEEN